jgi:uncharacterized protein YndB with AHSA1/START domain
MRPDPHGPSDASVRSATGRGWEAWLTLLDRAGATQQDHKGIVALLAEAGVERAWWRQTIAVAYEKVRGLRATVGETADAGFQVGVRRTLPRSAADAWRDLVEGDGRALWLGPGATFHPTPGTTYRCDDGTEGEVRTVRAGRRVRLTWRPPDAPAETTLQLTLEPKGERCVVAFHHERLPDADARERVKARWREVLATLAARWTPVG